MIVKSFVKAAERLSIVRCFVGAAMKKDRYEVYTHISHNTEDILSREGGFKFGAGRFCKHVVSCLYQLVDLFESEKKEVPDDETCTDLL